MRQLKQVRSILENKGLDAVLISNQFNMRYISGFTGGTGYLYISQKRSVVLTDFRYTIQAQRESNLFEVLEVENSYSEEIGSLVREEEVKKLGFEGMDILYEVYKKLEEELKFVQLVSMGDSLSALRSVKTHEELECIKMAEAIGDKAFEEVLKWIKPGMTELEVAAYLEYTMKSNGAEGLSFDTIVASGIHSSMPHAVPTTKKLEQGDFVTMDFGCIYKGYCSDMTRTIVIGKANDRQRKVYDTVLQAQLKVLDFIKAGYQGKEIDKIAREFIYQAGYEGCFGHSLGHSVGLFIHEEPRLSMKEERIIKANVVVTVEPGIYIKDFGGVRIEDLVVVTEAGCKNYTHSPKNLIEID